MIEVGEYVRTRKGIIGRLREQYIYGNGAEYPEPQEWVIDRFNNKRNYYVTNEADVDFDEIVKHSKNIIDLIEVGDYVNGKKIERINDYGDFKRADFNLDYDDSDAVYEENIKSVVTKEQFENIEYRLEN